MNALLEKCVIDYWKPCSKTTSIYLATDPVVFHDPTVEFAGIPECDLRIMPVELPWGRLAPKSLFDIHYCDTR